MRIALALLMPGLSLTLLVCSSCGTTSGDQGRLATARDSTVRTPYSGSTAVGITHEVRDFDAWLKAYRAHSDPDSRIGIFANPDDPNLITVFELSHSHEEARTAFMSQEFRDTMEAEGVTSEPILYYFDVKFRVTAPTDKKYRLGVSHEVDNYEQWKKIFDEDQAIRDKANLELRAISTRADNPLSVNILFATDDLQKAKEVINSGELRTRMKVAGVLTEPVFAVFVVSEERPR